MTDVEIHRTDSKGSAQELEKPRIEEEELAALPTAQAKIAQQNAALYLEALERYGADGSGLDPVAEKKLKRKLDLRIIPALAVCYFFYVSRPRGAGIA
jgi:hypothetical protein